MTKETIKDTTETARNSYKAAGNSTTAAAGNKARNIAVILAGGSGRRFSKTQTGTGQQGKVPKQFLPLVAGGIQDAYQSEKQRIEPVKMGDKAGRESEDTRHCMDSKTVIEYTLDAFEQNQLIDEICVVCNKDYIEQLSSLCSHGQYSKQLRIIPGGDERYLSSIAAIRAYSTGVDGKSGAWFDDCTSPLQATEPPTIRYRDANATLLTNQRCATHQLKEDDIRLVFHDAARPLVSQRVITQTVAALDTWGAAAAAVKTTDTIFCTAVSDGCRTVQNIVDRSALYNAQTPQAFRLNVIREAYSIALHDKDFFPTDDCAAVLKYLPYEPIFLVEGDVSNIKITYEEDLSICATLLALQKHGGNF